MGEKDLRTDKIGAANGDNRKHIMERRSPPAVLHCHLVAAGLVLNIDTFNMLMKNLL